MVSAVKVPVAPISADNLRERVRSRYSGNGCFVLEEVRDAGGFNASRAVDMLAMETWPSKRYVTRAFEIKVTRSDWLRERADPSKAEAFAAMADEFWVVSPPGVALVEELPIGYGLLHSSGTERLKLMRQAVTRVGAAGAIDRSLVAAMLVRSQDAKRIQRLVTEAREDERAVADERARRRVESQMLEADALRNAVAEFEARSGVHIGSYSGGHIGEAVKIVLAGLPHYARQVGFAHERLAALAEQLGEVARVLAEPIAAAPTEGVTP